MGIVDGEPNSIFLFIVESFCRAYDLLKERIKPKTPEEKRKLELLDLSLKDEFVKLLESKGYHFEKEALAELEKRRSEIMRAVNEDLSNLSKKEENPRVTDLYHDGEEITLCVSAGNVYLYLHFENREVWEHFKEQVNGEIADLNKPRRPRKT
jgi:hypothetical protein